MTGCAEGRGPAHPPPSGGPERAWSSEPHSHRPRPSSAPHDAWRQAALSGGAESGAEADPGRARLARVAEGPSGGRGSRGGPARSVSWERARVRRAGLAGRPLRGPGERPRLSAPRRPPGGARARASSQPPRRRYPPAPIPGRPGRTAREGRVSRCVSPAPTSAPPGEIVSLWQISRYKSRPDSVRKSSFRVSGPSTLFVSKADLSPSFPLHVSVGNSIKYDSKQITLAVSFPQRLSKSWIRNARNGEGARRSRHHWGWFLLGEEAPPSPVPTVGSCRDGPSGQLEEPAAQSWFCSHLPTQDPLSSASKRFQFSWTVRGT